MFLNLFRGLLSYTGNKIMEDKKDFTLTKIGKQVKKWIVLLPLAFISLFYLQKQYFHDSDLGRHITNGKVILETGKIPTTNLYSYTQPDRPTTMHHWGSGVVYYLVQSNFGFDGLHLFSVVVYMAALGVFVWLAVEVGSIKSAFFSLVLLAPVIGFRNEIRPEQFSYLLLSLTILLCWRVWNGKVTRNVLWIFLLMMAVWVNLHIYYFLGLGVVFVFGVVASLINKKAMNQFIAFFIFGMVGVALNPLGLKALWEPLLIFNPIQKTYVLENQPVWVLLSVFGGQLFVHFLAVFGIALYLINKSWKKIEKKLPLFLVLLLIVGSGVLMARNVSMGGMALVVLLAWGLNGLLTTKWKSGFLGLSVGFLVVLSLIKNDWYFSPFSKPWGLGILPGSEDVGGFLRKNNIQGPIFNNFDVGGYLIYYLFPEERVFVDNRAEAYSQDFFSQVYISMQTDEQVWQKVDGQYRFNAIVVSYKDATDFLRPFLERRIQDPQWKQVFKDEYIQILVRADT